MSVLGSNKNIPNGYKEVVDLLIDFVQTCVGSNNKIPPLSCEKVLFHIANEYSVKKCYSDQLKIAQLLQTLLQHRNSPENQAVALHKNIADLLLRTCKQMSQSGETLLCLQFKLSAIISMISGKYSEEAVMEYIVKCSSWHQMTSSRSCDLLTFYDTLDQCLPGNIKLEHMSLFLCHYYWTCCDNSEEDVAEQCLKRLSNLSVKRSSLLEGLVALIRTCHLLDVLLKANKSIEEDGMTNAINEVIVKFKNTRKSTILPAVIFVMEWLNKLLMNTHHVIYSAALFGAVSNLEWECYLPYVDDRKKIIVYKMLLTLLFAQVKLILECGDTKDDKLLQQSTKLALSVVKEAEMCCDKLG